MAFKVKLPVLYIGTAYYKAFVLVHDDGLGNQTPIDLSGFEGKLQVRRREGAPTDAEWSTANGFLKFELNRVIIDLPTTETKDYTFVEDEWDLLIWPVGEVTKAEVLMLGTLDAKKTKTKL